MKRPFARAWPAALLVVAFVAAAPVRAAGSASVAVNASVTATCTFTQSAGQQLLFTNATGGIDPTLGTDATATTTITYKCTRGSTPSFTFTSPNDSGGLHYVVSSGNAIGYSVAFTSGGAGSGFGSGTDKTLMLNGTITSAQYTGAPVGVYADTLTVNILP